MSAYRGLLDKSNTKPLAASPSEPRWGLQLEIVLLISQVFERNKIYNQFLQTTHRKNGILQSGLVVHTLA
jgi:hypothetical protein